MAKLGVLVHGYHLEAPGWDMLTWGDPGKDLLGSFPALAVLLLHRMQHDELTSIVFGSTTGLYKDGLSHGEYTMRYVAEHFHELAAFPRVRSLVDKASPDDLKRLREAFNSIVLADIKNTTDEIASAAQMFYKQGADEVVQIAAANHGPRCIQLQLLARSQGAIPPEQLWFVHATDVCHADATPLSTAIFEPPHRGDDPMLHFRPMMPEVMKRYQYGLPANDKKELISMLDAFMEQHATDDDVRQFGSHKK